LDEFGVQQAITLLTSFLKVFAMWRRKLL